MGLIFSLILATFGILLDFVSTLTALKIFGIAESAIMSRPELLLVVIYPSLLAIHKLGEHWRVPDWLINGLTSIIIVATFYPGFKNLLVILGLIPEQVREFYFHEFNFYSASGFNRMFWIFVMEMLILVPAYLSFLYFSYSVKKSKEILSTVKKEA